MHRGDLADERQAQGLRRTADIAFVLRQSLLDRVAFDAAEIEAVAGGIGLHRPRLARQREILRFQGGVPSLRMTARTAVALFAQRFLTMVLSDDLIEFERMVIAVSKRFPQIGQAIAEFGLKRGIDRLAPFMAVYGNDSLAQEVRQLVQV